MSRRSSGFPSLTRRSVLVSLGGFTVSGCLGAPDHGASGTTPSEAGAEPSGGNSPTDEGVEATTVVSDLEVPWDLTLAGDVTFLTERETGVRRLDTETLQSGQDLIADEIEFVIGPSDLPDFTNPDFGGFLGIAAHPSYPNPPTIFLNHSVGTGGTHNRVVRYDVEARDVSTLVDSLPGGSGHFGGRMAFGPDGALWITTGDAGDSAQAQDPASLAGAILRVTEDGDPAPENPTFDVNADPRTVTYGHRNPQGIAFVPNGDVVFTDHGPAGRDEVGVVYPGANYGWPIARGGPDDPDYDSYGTHDEFTPPVLNTGPDTTWAPSGATFYSGTAIEAWRNRLLVAGLLSETLYAVTLVRSGDDRDSPLGADGVRFDAGWLDERYTATAHPFFAGEYGRLRHVKQGPNGSVLLLTSNRDGRASDPFPSDGDDRIVRIDPA